MKILTLTGTLMCLALPVMGSPQSRGTSLAQKLVNDAHAKHPEAKEIGIATIGSKECTTIASTDKKDIGEKCEAEDSDPIRTDKPHVGKEGENFDVTLPLRDQSGKTVGSVGIELAPKSGETQENIVKRAQEIEKGMEPAITSKASLTESF